MEDDDRAYELVQEWHGHVSAVGSPSVVSSERQADRPAEVCTSTAICTSNNYSFAHPFSFIDRWTCKVLYLVRDGV